MIKAGSDELKQKNPKFKEVERRIQNLVKTAEQQRGRGVTVVVAASKKNILKPMGEIGEEDEDEDINNNDLFKALENEANEVKDESPEENLYR